MVYKGTVRNGKVELEEDVALPDGAAVRIELVAGGPDPVDGLPDDAVSTGIPDLSVNHDHYAHGSPKRED